MLFQEYVMVHEETPNGPGAGVAPRRRLGAAVMHPRSTLQIIWKNCVSKATS